MGLISQASSVLAIPVTYDFTVEVDDGPLSGNQYFGNTTFDLADLMEDPEDPEFDIVVQPTINFNFVDNLFTEADDIEFPSGDFPIAAFQDGRFLGLSYLVDESDFLPQNINPVTIPGEVVYFEIFLDSFAYGIQPDGFLEGTVSYTQRDSAVPEPSAIAGLIFFGLSLVTNKTRLCR